MGWPYEFLTLSDEDKLLRRNTLDLYAAIAHASALLPAFLYLIFRLILARISRPGASASDGHGEYEQVPRSPLIKARRMDSPARLAAHWSRLSWWMGSDVYFRGAHWGQRDQWVLAFAWTAWLVVLSVMGTGKDYLHLTKRLGMIAVSQLPIQYLLSLKALNPFAWAFRSSHEHINRYHRVLGRIVYGFIIAHIILYEYFFLMKGVWLRRMLQFVVLCGSGSAVAFTALFATSTVSVMIKSYRVFFVTHLVVAFAVPAMLFIHAPPIRVYLVEALVVFLFDLATRRMGIVVAPTALETIPGTNLVKASITLPSAKADRFRALPGSHVYLSIPPAARSSEYPPSKDLIVDFMFNPFTVASVNDDNNDITLVARTRSGPMSTFLSHHAASNGKVHLGVDGPYGALGKHYHDLISSKIQRVLLFAGGVGATFALPIYQAILHDNPVAKVRLVWAIRGAGDATWAVSRDTSGQSVLADENIELFLTGDMGAGADPEISPANGDDVHLSTMHHDSRRGRYTSQHNRKRPDFDKIIDTTFRQGTEETIAILVCGPAEMARDIRARVTPWVMRGRKVWWHNESFGW
ncbi:hypothetical protein B0I35DRAFT_370466 [Stachybotrys elegans]|uniref:ferric-chelate reductase (NADPH) n=1 Tax=Stachybotrys elegans TaxID=80388 RepID=A0A8K0T3I8_9HYPO|nr:hypothetical protein B0I35DRAFT_370466 [Stachybotrys elegans]